MFSTHSEVHIESIQMLNPCFVMLGVPWLHSSKTTYQLAVLWLYSNLHPKHRLRHPNVLGLRRGQSQDHWNSSKFTPWPLRHGAAEQCCFKCSRVPAPSKKCISTSWRMGWQSNGRCGDLILPNAGDAIMVVMVVVNLEFPKRFWNRSIEHMMK